LPSGLRYRFFSQFVPLVATWEKGAMVKGCGRERGGSKGAEESEEGGREGGREGGSVYEQGLSGYLSSLHSKT